MKDIKKACFELFLKNKRKLGKYQYTVPSPDTYPYQWLWDSCFHAIILSHFNIRDAKAEILTLLSKQFDNGLIPHMIYWDRKTPTDFPVIEWGKKDTSTITQPPMIAYAVWQIFQKDKDIRFIKNISCNFDAPFCMRNFFWVKDVPFNAIMVENLKLLAKLAAELSLENDAKFFKDAAAKIAEAMKKYMLDKGVFWPTYGENYQKIEVKTWAIFAPLFAGILTQNQANDLIKKHLLNPKEFWTKYPAPTVSMDEPSFDPEGFWRGPVWIATNWFIYQGLKNYGFYDIAKQIKESSIALIEKSGFREYFNPNTGEGFGAKDFTWGGLVLDMN